MIKVIKKGTRKTVECPHCGSVLTYEEEDIEKSGSSALFGCSQNSRITCPECTKVIILSSTR